MGKSRKPLEMQKGNLTVLQQERKKQEEAIVRTGKNQLSKPPSWLIDDVAKAEYKRIVKELRKIDIIGNLDLDNLGGYANAFSTYVKITKALSEELTKGIVVTYAVEDKKTHEMKMVEGINGMADSLSKLQKQYAEEMRKFAALCGLTIDSRLKAASSKVEKQEDNIQSQFGI